MVAARDVEGMARLLIDAEMKMFSGLRTPVIFLQNVVTDLLLGMGLRRHFAFLPTTCGSLQRGAGLHNHEDAASRCSGANRHRKSDCMREYK